MLLAGASKNYYDFLYLSFLSFLIFIIIIILGGKVPAVECNEKPIDYPFHWLSTST